MAQTRSQILIRWIFHLLLAIFLANAANKFFVADLDFELSHHFYTRIFAGEGDAPDQYRMLPLLPLKLLCEHLPFNHAVLIYNAAFGFMVLELFWWIMGSISRPKKTAFNVLFGLAWIYLQHSGWRPDTMGLLLLSALLVMPPLVPTGRSRMSGGMALLATGLIVALAFARTDIALFLGLYLSIYHCQNWGFRVLWLLIPIGLQYSLQAWIYPDASYYSDKFMLLTNLKMHYILRNPTTYLLLALGFGFRKKISSFFKATWDYKWFYLLCLLYLGLVLVVGRLSEYRLYLPFVPVFLVIWREMENGEKTN